MSPSGERESRGDQRRTDAGAPEAPPPRLVAFAVLRAVVNGNSEAGIGNRRHVGCRRASRHSRPFPSWRVRAATKARRTGCCSRCPRLRRRVRAGPRPVRPAIHRSARVRGRCRRPRSRRERRPGIRAVPVRLPVRPSSGNRCRRLPPLSRRPGDRRRRLPGPPGQAPLRPRRSRSHRRRGAQRYRWLLRRPQARRSSPLSGAARNPGRSRVRPRHRGRSRAARHLPRPADGAFPGHRAPWDTRFPPGSPAARIRCRSWRGPS